MVSLVTPSLKAKNCTRGASSKRKISKMVCAPFHVPLENECAYRHDLVTDRLAYLNFVQGSLASSLALKLDSARAPLKALRDAETKLTPRRNMRSGLQLQLSKLEHEQQKGAEKRIAELKDQIKDAELDDQVLEKEAEILKRKAVRESEQLKWEALREVSAQRYLLRLILRASVWGETCSPVSSCYAHYWRVAFYPSFPDFPVCRCTDYRRCSCFASASPRQLQDRAYQLTSPSLGGTSPQIGHP